MASKIPFHIPYLSGDESTHVQKVISSNKIGTGGYFSQACEEFLQEYTSSKKVLLTSSCTHALEMSAMLLNIQEGDEVIMPSYNFVSAANAFVLRGAKIVFVDVDPISMNVDPESISSAITSKTKAVLIMHYGGFACDMEKIMPIIKANKLFLIEDAAHCIGSTYKGKHLGTYGHLSTLSFHYTKNIHCGEGGALMINDDSLVDRAEIIREKGTNRKQFFDGKIDKYTWVDIGSSYLMSELSAAFLWGQLNQVDFVTKNRRDIYQKYDFILKKEGIRVPSLSSGDIFSNAHTLFLKSKSQGHRKLTISNLKQQGIGSSFHYIPLHLSPSGNKFGRFHGKDKNTTKESNKLLRLPIYPDLKTNDIKIITDTLLKIILDYEVLQN